MRKIWEKNLELETLQVSALVYTFCECSNLKGFLSIKTVLDDFSAVNNFEKIMLRMVSLKSLKIF